MFESLSVGPVYQNAVICSGVDVQVLVSEGLGMKGVVSLLGYQSFPVKSSSIPQTLWLWQSPCGGGFMELFGAAGT